MAAGRVITGYSKPYVALYAASEGAVTYSSGMQLARGVSVSISPDAGSDNKFYADNVEAETAGSVFTSGTADIEIDGLKSAARKLIYGLPAAGEDGWVHYGDSQQVPYIGFGCVVRYMEDGVTTYEPLVLPKIMFQPEPTEAATQEEDIDWQTTSLTADIFRDDTANHDWKLAADSAFATEAAAEAQIKTLFNIAA